MENLASLRELLVTPYVTLHYDPARKIVRYVRTETPLPPMEEAEDIFSAIREAIEPFDRDRVGLLVDLRAAPGRNDKEFETKMERWRGGFFARFARVSILVKTAAGKLQVMRLGAASGRAQAVFTDEHHALLHLTAHEAHPAPVKAAR
jgi:hypothetical protein